MNASHKVKAQFTLPELYNDHLIKWDLHVTKQLGKHNMIIGRDILQFLKIDLRFSDNVVKWDNAEMPFKDGDVTPREAYHIADPVSMEDSVERIKRILDAKHEKANLSKICHKQSELDEAQKKQLEALLFKDKALFDGQLGHWHGQEVKINVKEGTKPYHARAFNIPQCHILTLKAEVERLCKIGVLKKVNRSEWAAPTFIIPKKDGPVCFISDF